MATRSAAAFDGPVRFVVTNDQVPEPQGIAIVFSRARDADDVEDDVRSRPAYLGEVTLSAAMTAPVGDQKKRAKPAPKPAAPRVAGGQPGSSGPPANCSQNQPHDMNLS